MIPILVIRDKEEERKEKRRKEGREGEERKDEYKKGGKGDRRGGG
jgi:hypothetical protein